MAAALIILSSSKVDGNELKIETEPEDPEIETDELEELDELENDPDPNDCPKPFDPSLTDIPDLELAELNEIDPMFWTKAPNLFKTSIPWIEAPDCEIALVPTFP